jgi:hypothetical protein
MTKAEQARLVAWRLMILRWSQDEPGQAARNCRYFGISRAGFYHWKRYEKPRPDHRLQMDVKFLERTPGLESTSTHRPHGALDGQAPYERLLTGNKK